MALAVEQVRRMRGGAQSHLMRCSNQAYYVVKFQNNPQGLRILANELLGTRLAARLGLSVAEPEVVEVRAELIAHTEDLVIQLGRGRAPCKAGKQFGSRYPGNLADVAVYDFLPDEQLREVTNIAEFWGMLVFDKWTCNTNGRQAIFFREADGAGHSVGQSVERGAGAATRYCARMIDNGFCFNAAEWNFPDAPLRGLYARHRVYEGVRGIHSKPGSRVWRGLKRRRWKKFTGRFRRSGMNDVFRRHRILGKLAHRVRVEGFTQPGNPMRLDYGYQNGVRGFIQSVSLWRDLPQAKALAYTAGCIRARLPRGNHGHY
jgi:hypothetical protein